MCGCYELKAKARELNRHFRQLRLGQSEMPPSGDLHPTDPVLMITGSDTGYVARKARWGLVGGFLDKEPRNPVITLHSEGLVAKPFYSKILKRSRCLIPATAFYEWLLLDDRKQKIRISQTKGETLMFAGIFDHHPLVGTTCAILTTAANDTVSPALDRIPVILDRDESSFWLDEYPEFPDAEFVAILQAPSLYALTTETVVEEEPSPQLSLFFG